MTERHDHAAKLRRRAGLVDDSLPEWREYRRELLGAADRLEALERALEVALDDMGAVACRARVSLRSLRALEGDHGA